MQMVLRLCGKAHLSKDFCTLLGFCRMSLRSAVIVFRRRPLLELLGCSASLPVLLRASSAGVAL